MPRRGVLKVALVVFGCLLFVSISMVIFLPPPSPRLIGKAKTVREAYRLLHPNQTSTRQQNEQQIQRERPPWEGREGQYVSTVRDTDQDERLETPSPTGERYAEQRQSQISTTISPATAQQVERPDLYYNCHLFYYAWYGNPETDGKWVHWNHEYMPHWEKRINDRYPIGKKHEPPEDIGANYYPLLGAYSSANEETIKAHMQQIVRSKCGTIILSWWGRGSRADSNGDPTEEKLVQTIISIAEEFHVKVGFHIEPYEDRTASSVKQDIVFLISEFGSSPAFYKLPDGRPVVYIYDSYKISPVEWASIFDPHAKQSIRGSLYDAFVVGLWVEQSDGHKLSEGKFDAAYTYFAAEGFVYGSSRSNWQAMAAMAKRNSLEFIPSIGPGYIDTSVRPWNGANTRSRNAGKYYRDGFQFARNSQPKFVSITSFNEWHEGSQIEAAVSKKGYQDYEDLGGAYAYLDLTAESLDSLFSSKK